MTQTITRNIIEINEALCTGCGQCVLDCAEGAIAIVNGKATVVSDSYCDGLGACLSGCPTGALTIIQRKAVPFDEEAALRHMAQSKGADPKPTQGCPGAALREFAPASAALEARAGTQAPFPMVPGAGLVTKRFWPIKLRLVPPTAPFLRNAHLLVTADCGPAASPLFHTLAKDKVILLACPKFENNEDVYGKLRAIFATAMPASVTVLHMEVPCCKALLPLCVKAAQEQKAPIAVQEIVLGCNGEILHKD